MVKRKTFTNIPTKTFPRYALTNFTDKECMLNAEDTGSMENLFEIRRYQIDIDNEKVENHLKWENKFFFKLFSSKRPSISPCWTFHIFCHPGLPFLMGEQRSRGAALLQPVRLPQGQPRLLWEVIVTISLLSLLFKTYCRMFCSMTTFMNCMSLAGITATPMARRLLKPRDNIW